MVNDSLPMILRGHMQVRNFCVHNIVIIYLPFSLNMFWVHHLHETVLLSTNNMCCGQDIRKIIFCDYLLTIQFKSVMVLLGTHNICYS